MTNFQIAVLGIFIFLTIVGVAAFALVRSNNLAATSEVTLWAALDRGALAPLIESLNKEHESSFKLTLVEKEARTIEADLVEALASGRGPDLIILPHETILAQAERLLAIPYQSYSRRDYQDTYLEAGEIFAAAEGLLAIPLFVDPLVMYYDKDKLDSSALAQPPDTWTKLLSMAPVLREKDERGKLRRGALPLGEFNNIPNAKELLALLMMQAGNPIVETGDDGQIHSTLNELRGYATAPAVFALNFFLQFADPAKSTYSWDGSFPQAPDAFSQGRAVFYLGSASEYPTLRLKNPHQNFDVALMPQRGDGPRLTSGELYGVAVIKQGTNQTAAFKAAYALTAQASARQLSQALALPPARRDLLVAPPQDPTLAIFYRSAIMMRAWPDGARAATRAIFRRLVESAKSGRFTLAEAVAEAHRELNALLSHE